MSIVPYAKLTIEFSDGSTASMSSLTYYQNNPAESRPEVIEVLQAMFESDDQRFFSAYNIIKKTAKKTD